LQQAAGKLQLTGIWSLSRGWLLLLLLLLLQAAIRERHCWWAAH
jgi:hypothetical protein